MASFVVVVDASARRVKVKTIPATSLSEILQEACKECRLDASRHGLKYNNKALDLSRTVRLSGLSSGAKLELVKLSKTPSAISVALQLPETEIDGAPNGRLMDKFPSSISLWQILRRFESATAGGLGSQKNFTGRGVPSLANGDSGAGRLYYEGPVLQIMGREYSSLVDLQRSLSQLGFNDGSVLLKLSFRASLVPLEEAQKQVSDYFDSVEEVRNDSDEAYTGAIGDAIPINLLPLQTLPGEEQESKIPDSQSLEIPEPARDVQADAKTANGPVVETNGSVVDDLHEPVAAARAVNDIMGATNTTNTVPNVTGPDCRPISVYAPPSSTTPKAARQPHNEADYELSIAQHQRYQASLGKLSQQQRLQSDKEIEAQQKEQVEKLSSIKEVEIKIRFPNQVQVAAKFTNLDTSITLYDFVKGLMEHEGEPFSLKFTSAKGLTIVPKGSSKRLITDLGMTGRVLITVVWDEGASIQARNGNIVKAEFRKVEQPIEIPEARDDIVEDTPSRGWGRLGEGKISGNRKAEGLMNKILGKTKKR